MDILQIPILSDNYSYILYDSITKKTACVDPAEPEPILNELEKKNFSLDYIFNTHHHLDHTGGNLKIKKQTGCKIFGPELEKSKIPCIDFGLREGNTYTLGSLKYKVIETPGHTSGHICLYFFEDNVLFSGDTLFSMGCGRIFEGTYLQMWESLKKLRNLPNKTDVYCGHEYTKSNIKFATHIDPKNLMLKKKQEKVLSLRTNNQPTVPFKLYDEKIMNPFLRADDEKFKQILNVSNKNSVQVFAELRKQKDDF